MTDATERFLTAMRNGGWKIKGAGRDRWTGQCPAHNGQDLNLSIAKGDQGVLIRDWSHSCAEVDIARAVGLGLRDLFDQDGRARYDYGNGYVIERRRTDSGKTVRPVSAGITPDVRPLWSPAGSAPIANSAVVMLCEGEKTADALVRLGAPCVATWAGGTNGVDKADYAPLSGRTVVIVPDNDEPGQKALMVLADLLAPIAAEVKVWRTPEMFNGQNLNDAADLWLAGGSLDDLEDAPAASATDTEAAVNADPHSDAVSLELARMRARRDAQRLFEAENNPTPDLPQLTRLDAFLSEPDEDAEYRIDGLMPTGANVVLAAQFKAGKSTLIGNMIGAMSGGESFLGNFATVQANRIVLIDDELDPRTLRRWLRDHQIPNPERVELVSLRGKLSSFDIINPVVRAEWAKQIGTADVLILDCLRPVLDVLGLDENRDAGKFLVAFDSLKGEAGIDEGVIVHHMGHNGERSRGDSRILDWPDVTWRVVRESEDPSSPRYFSAFGRDVSVAEGGLQFDPHTRGLTFTEGDRKQANRSKGMEAVKPAVLSFIRANPGCSGENILGGIGGNDKDKRAAREALIDEGLITASKRPGKGGGLAYHAVTPVTPAEPRLDGVQTPVTPVYRRGYGLKNEVTEPRFESEIF